MKARIERLRMLAQSMLARGRMGGAAGVPAGATVVEHNATGAVAGAAGRISETGPSILTIDGVGANQPEQPVLLLPSGPRMVHVGEVLPARRSRWPLSVVRLPVVPKRAILAAGVCAGLAGPAIAKHLATRMLLGGATPGKVEGVLEITRIVYNGPLSPQATNAISRAIMASRR